MPWFLLAFLNCNVSYMQLRHIQTQPLVGWFLVDISARNALFAGRNYFAVGKEN